MDINQVTEELDALFAQKKIDEIPQFLESHIAQAIAEGANDVLLTLYNEIIGFYRETGRYDLSIEYCHRAIALIEDMGIQDTIPCATTLLNAANAHRAAGMLQESLELYNKVRPIYVAQLDEDDMYFANFYNNLSLLYQEMNDFASAKEQLVNALYIVTHKPDKQFEVAVTQANLANTCIELGQDEEAKARAEEAIRMFEELGVDDAHYSAALSALGSLYYMDKDYANALSVMEKSRDCVAKYLGKDNIQYQRLSDNIRVIENKIAERTLAEEEAGVSLATEAGEVQENSAAASGQPAVAGVSEMSEGTTEASGTSGAAVFQEDAIIREPAMEERVAVDSMMEEPGISDPLLGQSVIKEPVIEEPVINEPVTGQPVIKGLMMEGAVTEEPVVNEPVVEDLVMAESVMNEFVVEEPVMKESVIEESVMNDSAMREPAIEEPIINEPVMEQPVIEEPVMEEHGVENSVAGGPEMAQNTGIQEETVPEDAGEDLRLEIPGLELCRRYYEEYGRPMIAEKFRAYEPVIAVGLVGKGSDCFGYDDALSRDHDYGPRFVMWVTKKVYEEIGEELQEAYEGLPGSFMGVERVETFHGRDRCGVMVIEDFYKNILGFNLVGMLARNQEDMVSGKDPAVAGKDPAVTGKDPAVTGRETMDTIKSWLAVHDYALAAAVNGEVFRDDEGIFSMYRDMLKEYYPKAVWYRKIAQTCALFSQSGQYNLPRMRMRGQFVAAELAKAECAKQAMKLYYLLNRTYAPHDKWLFKGLPDNPQMTIRGEGAEPLSVTALVEQISLLPVDKAHETELTTAIESLAVIFANELEKKDMVGKCDLYLDACTKELTAKSDALLTAIVANTPVITALSLSIAKAEFEAFDKVQNEGGHASCQNNWPTFKVMRMSQYMTWTEDMLLQYLYEFKSNFADGRNMIEEKYARMMESTAPLEYACFADQLPPVSEEKKAVIEQVVDIQVKWMEEFAAAYPKLADDARRIHTSEDLPDDTSYETYLRGELGTYSDRMLEMYGRYIVAHAQEGRNVAREIMENTVRFYGYQDLEAASNAKAG